MEDEFIAVARECEFTRILPVRGENTRNIPFETFETWCRTTPEAPGVNLQAFGAHGGSVVSEGRMSLRLSKRIFISNPFFICLLPFLFLFKRNVV